MSSFSLVCFSRPKQTAPCLDCLLSVLPQHQRDHGPTRHKPHKTLIEELPWHGVRRETSGRRTPRSGYRGALGKTPGQFLDSTILAAAAQPRATSPESSARWPARVSAAHVFLLLATLSLQHVDCRSMKCNVRLQHPKSQTHFLFLQPSHN